MYSHSNLLDLVTMCCWEDWQMQARWARSGGSAASAQEQPSAIYRSLCPSLYGCVAPFGAMTYT